MSRVILIALDSVGIDPLGHDRPESVYAHSRFLFPRQVGLDPLPLPDWFAGIRFASWNATATGDRITPPEHVNAERER